MTQEEMAREFARQLMAGRIRHDPEDQVLGPEDWRRCWNRAHVMFNVLPDVREERRAELRSRCVEAVRVDGVGAWVRMFPPGKRSRRVTASILWAWLKDPLNWWKEPWEC